MEKFETIIYKKFGKCLHLSSKHLHLLVTTDVGPRIIFLSTNLKDNILFEDTNDSFTMQTPAFKKKFGNDAIWHCYGGHRLWVSPETLNTYAPDNVPVTVKQTGNTYHLIAPKQSVTNLQFSMSITLKDNQVKIQHKITNLGAKAVILAPWALTALAPDGVATFKMNDHDTGFLPNRHFSVWPYTDLKDSRLHLDNKYISLESKSNIDKPIKLGFDAHYGQASYVYKRNKLTISYHHTCDGNYPDGGCSLETYTNSKFLEIETLGKIVNLKSKQSVAHEETWIVEPV